MATTGNHLGPSTSRSELSTTENHFPTSDFGSKSGRKPLSAAARAKKMQSFDGYPANEFTRRILNFPAIHPCESVSSSALLTSLINLGHTICSFKSKSFFTNKKNVKNSIRLIENLVLFLEEIQNSNSIFNDSMALSLSELHFIFQKVRFLLEDCSRDDARLWMLVKSEKVATHFQVLIRAIVVALDVFPLVELDVVDELEELVDFVRKQVLKSKFGVENDDRRAMRRVLRILDQFEGGIAPESIDLKRILDYLRIERWIECNREIRFLESEIGEENLGAEKRDLGFLSSLMAFLIYCRCTLFVSIENVSNGVLEQSGEMIVDRREVITVDLVPNHAMKRVIQQYYQIPSRRNREPSPGVGSSVVADQAMSLLANFLICRLGNGTNEEQQKALYEIRLLSKTSIFNRSCLVEADAMLIPHLLDKLCFINPGGQENAMAAILNFLKYSRNKTIVAENGGLSMIIDVLNNGLKIEARQHAAGALFYLASIEEYRRKIGKSSGAIAGLMDLIRDGPNHAKKNSLAAILGFLMCHENHWRVLSAGLVPILVNVLKSSEKEDIITYSLAILATLAEKFDGAMSIITAGTLPIIVEILSSSTSRTAKEYCVSALLALCMNDEADVVPILVKNQYLMVALYSLLADGSSRSSKKASSLIRILHAFDEKSTFGAMASGMPQEQFVHVW
ncbi:hypothetical protein BUALT_Bualt17G0048100 [Buddleja alternifolia]|uniref:ARM repeat superfamily protein n=1 Tax=Buddleja alternifolia TaxID=168488 RepID=A0AAV6W672_9LAMI|nr:hypothetical protein BUALT_Bualt17G0048100 [Buddleja alternifolia]